MLKIFPTLLLTLMGLAAYVIAGRGEIGLKWWLVVLAVGIAAAGANGITNYLDGNLDATMPRTRRRALASGKIFPPERALPMILGLIVAGLVLAWWLHPLVAVADAAGTLMAVLWRKKATCVFPQGAIASWAPLLMGWFAWRPTVDWVIGFLCLLITLWLPLHVWSVIIAHREEYLAAGLTFFPIKAEVKDSVKLLLAFAVGLFVVGVALYFVGDFSSVYLVAAAGAGSMMLWASLRLVLKEDKAEAWKLYKLSSFPFLALLMMGMVLDLWLMG
ncbi:UbiA family prenyltransferase [Chloroflexota bacterium]